VTTLATGRTRKLRRDASGTAQHSLWGKEASAKAIPFIKWAGGKSQLLSKIQPFYPREPYETYFEPFLGGGAVFFDLRPRIAFLTDSNKELITAYRVVKSSVEELIVRLDKLAAEYHEDSEKTYYRVRDDWDLTELDPISSVARFIFLNKTCYNGLYRVNRQGKFNVPWGKEKNSTICEPEKLLAASQALRGALLRSMDFREALKAIGGTDFVYVDPPYQPVSKTASFTGYTKDQFGMEDQVDLAEELARLDRAGARFLLSNSFSRELESLYRQFGFKVTYVTAPRAISSNPKTRGQTKELLIRNY